jgi:hypothetical protein
MRLRISSTKSTTFYSKIGFYIDLELKTLVIMFKEKRIYIYIKKTNKKWKYQ